VAELKLDDLQASIRDAARHVFTRLRGQHPDETFYAFALYTDDGAMTVVPAANSEEGLAAALEKAQADPEERSYYRWATAEWAYEAYDPDGHFGEICTRVREM